MGTGGGRGAEHVGLPSEGAEEQPACREGFTLGGQAAAGGGRGADGLGPSLEGRNNRVSEGTGTQV